MPRLTAGHLGEGGGIFVRQSAHRTGHGRNHAPGGTSGLVHTAAASSLGQMLVKLCLEEDVPLVTIVRKAEQVELLRSIGADHVCDSSLPSFMGDLIMPAPRVHHYGL